MTLPAIRPLTRSLLVLGLGLSFGAAGCGASEDPPEPGNGSADAAQAIAAVGPGGSLKRIVGPGGLTSPGLEPGTMLGAGAKLEPGQVVTTPKGTLAEIELGNGTLVRVGEDSTLALPTDAAPLSLERGEVYVRGASRIQSGPDTLTILRGEARAVSTGEAADSWREYGVIFGEAQLETGGKTVPLWPGATLETPLKETETEPKPLMTLRALEETTWARSFEAATQLAETVPRGTGSLTARRAGTNIERQRLKLTEQTINVNISGRLAHTEIEQAFYNETGTELEGIYRFPIPADASLSGLQLLVGNRWMEGAMVDKQRGKQIFQQIVDATVPRDPALLHWEKGNVFKLRIFPLPPKRARRVKIAWTQVLPVIGDKVRYRFPLGGSGATGTPIDKFRFAVNVDTTDLAEDQIAAIHTPMLDLDRKASSGRVELQTTRDGYLPTYDLGVDIPVATAQRRVESSTHLDRDGQAYFMVALRPELKVDQPRRPVDTVYVLDRSHGTTPELWATARGIVQASLATHGPEDRVALMACDTACDAWKAGLIPTGDGASAAATAFMDKQLLAGASDVGNMMRRAAQTFDGGGRERERIVVYLGDGVPTSGEMSTDGLRRAVREPLAGIRVQAVALGARSDMMVLRSLVEQTGGDLLAADPRDEPGNLVRELRLRAQIPVARGVEIELPPGLSHVHNQRPGGIRPGDSIVLLGRLDRPVRDPIVVRARMTDGTPVEETFDIDLQADRTRTAPHLPRTWAQAEIEHLTSTRGFDAKREIVDLSKRYTVLSRWTALIVLENDAMYREFGVRRRAGEKDGWNGNLADAEGGGGKGEGSPLGELGVGADGIGTRGSGSSSSGFGGRGATQPPPPTAAPSAPPSPDDLREAERRADRAPEPEPPAEDFDTPTAKPDPKPRPTRKPKSKKSSAKRPKPAGGLDLFEPGGGGRGVSRDEARPMIAKPRPVRQFSVREAKGPSQRELDRVADLQRARDAEPTKRAAHRSLVRTAARAGHAQTMPYALAWVGADPDHGDAILALADAMAADGDPQALRHYASAAEVRPFSERLHRQLATAFGSKGDWERACSHRLALVSIDPKSSQAGRDLERCRARDLPRASIPSSSDVRVELTWTAGDTDLDLALVDSRGRRLSVLRPRGVRVQESRGEERIGLSRLSGSVYVEVTAPHGARSIPAKVKIRTPEGTRSFDITVDAGTKRVARVSRSKRRPRRPW